MTDAGALTDILVYLAQSDDLKSTNVSKTKLPAECATALNTWTAKVNANAEEEVATFDSFDDNVLKCSYYDDDREFYIVQFAYFFQDKIQGWLIVQKHEVIGETATAQ